VQSTSAFTVTRNCRIVLLALLTGLLTFVFFLLCSFRPFASQGEPREALVAKSMVESGDYVIPYRYDNVFATKPPMVHWLMLVASGGESPKEWHARMPAALMSGIVAGLVFWFLGIHSSPMAGLIGVLLLNACPLWIRGSLEARVDLPLAGFLFLSLLASFSLFHSFGAKRFLWALAGIVALTCGLLTKGPLIVVLFGAIFGCYLFWIKTSLPRISFFLLALLAPPLLIAGIWYWLAYQERGHEFLAVFLSENVRRMQGSMQFGEDPHQHSILYLLYTGIAGLLPISIPFFWQLIEKPRFSLEDARGVISRVIHQRPSGLIGNFSDFTGFVFLYSIKQKS
jgi:4-amino-4-deoxy-L-arabinose transferase-like glycosyltransferase